MPEYMYGVREDGSVVSINDIGFSEAGLRCRCKCPKCHRDLQACSLHEKKVRRYFRHNNEGYSRDGIENLNGCTATSANESGLHMMAKELIAETRKIAFPPMSLALEQLNLPFSEDTLSRLPESTLLRPAFIFECNEVVDIEKPYPQFRPDVSVSGSGETFLIEIAVTHRVDADKREKVQKYGLPMLEIDLSRYVETGISRNDLQKIISEATEHKKWISLSKSLVDDAYSAFSRKAAAIQKRNEELAILRKKYFTPDVYSSTLSACRSNQAFDQYARRHLHFDATSRSCPFFIDIPISGEILFNCDRRIWQGKIFDRWVYYRTTDSISLWSIWNSLREEESIPFNPILDKKFQYADNDHAAYLPYEVIRQYFGYLEQLGFVSIDGKWAKVLRKHSLIPPNQEYAAHLKSVLGQVAGHSPTVSTSIGQKLHTILQAERERKAEQEREQQRIEAEQKRLQEEANKKAAEAARQRELEAIRTAIQNADYDQTNTTVIIANQRWLRCTECLEIKHDYDMASCGFPTRNKGLCRICARKQT